MVKTIILICCNLISCRVLLEDTENDTESEPERDGTFINTLHRYVLHIFSFIATQNSYYYSPSYRIC